MTYELLQGIIAGAPSGIRPSGFSKVALELAARTAWLVSASMRRLTLLVLALALTLAVAAIVWGAVARWTALVWLSLAVVLIVIGLIRLVLFIRHEVYPALRPKELP